MFGAPLASGSKFSYQRSNKGYLSLCRKLPEIYVRNSTIAGVPQVNDPTTTCMTLGAPILDAIGGTYSVPFSMKFRLDQLINHTDLVNIADQYKIKYVVVRLTYQCSTANVGSLTIMPNLQWIQDKDDATPPPTINSLREKMGVKFKTFGMNKICKIALKPAIMDTNAGAGGVVQNARPSYGWLSTDFANTEHYGIKGILSNVNLVTTTTSLTAFKVDVSVYVDAKDIQ